MSGLVTESVFRRGFSRNEQPSTFL